MVVVCVFGVGVVFVVDVGAVVVSVDADGGADCVVCTVCVVVACETVCSELEIEAEDSVVCGVVGSSVVMCCCVVVLVSVEAGCVVLDSSATGARVVVSCVGVLGVVDSSGIVDCSVTVGSCVLGSIDVVTCCSVLECACVLDD